MRGWLSMGVATVACLIASTLPATASAQAPTLAQLPGAAGCLLTPHPAGDRRPPWIPAPPTGCTPMVNGVGAPTMVASPDGRHVYVNGIGSGAWSLVTMRRDQVTGALTEGGCISAQPAQGCRVTEQMRGAKSSAVSPDGRNVYTVTDGMAFGTAGGIVTFARDAGTGELTQTGCTGNMDPQACPERDLAIAGASAVAVAPDGRHVYVGAQGRLVTLARGAGGKLTRVGCIGSDSGCEREPDLRDCQSKPPGACRADGGYVANKVSLSADGRRLYMASNHLLPRVFTRDPRSGELTTLPAPGCAALGVNLCPGRLDAVGLAVPRDGRDVYSTLSYFAGNPTVMPRPAIIRSRPLAGGPVLAPWGCLGGNLPLPCRPPPSTGVMGEIAMAPDDGAVYAAFRGLYARPPMPSEPSSGVVVLARDRDNGRLVPAGCVTNDGSGGRCVQGAGLDASGSILVSPDGRNVYVAGDMQIAVLGPAVAAAARTVRFSRSGNARMRLSCPAVARTRCRGRVAVASRSRTLATRSFSIARGRKARVALRLNRRGRTALRRGRRVRAQMTLRAGGRVSGRSVRQVTLRRARR